MGCLELLYLRGVDLSVCDVSGCIFFYCVVLVGYVMVVCWFVEVFFGLIVFYFV